MKWSTKFGCCFSLLLALGCGEQEGDLGGPGSDDDTSDAGASDDPGATDAGPSSVELPDPVPLEMEEVFRAPENLWCSNVDASCPGFPADLEFNPAEPGQLWVVMRREWDGQPCNEAGDPGCQLLRSAVAIVDDADTDAPQVQFREDGNSLHFMRLVTSLAFADDNTFATVGEARTGNYLDETLDFMGPTWWSADLDIFAQDFMLNGSHLDMLHATPFGMGIAHQRDHVFWCFNGDRGSVDRYDFNQPHEPGGADHSDGEYSRYADGLVKRRENVPSHMAFGPDNTTLFIADSGNRRVVKLDTTTGSEDGPVEIADDQIQGVGMTGAEWSVVVPRGVLRVPSGLEVFEGSLFVSDVETSYIHRFDLEGNPLDVFDTELPSGTLAGITIGPDERLYFVDWSNAAVYRSSWR